MTIKPDVTASDLQITVLVDNEVGDGLASKHGLSLWIKVAGKRILFDTGQGGALLGNARKLGVPLDETDVVILSHGHYDHTDGLPDVLALAPEARVIVSQGALVVRYSLHPSRPAKAVGMSDAARAALERRSAEKVAWSSGPVPIAPNVTVTGPIARETTYEDVGGPFFFDEGGQTPDPIADDQALWIDTAEGLIVCAGCCHAGLINTLNAIRNAGEDSRIRAVIGGFHLLHASDERLERTLDALQSLSPHMLVPCHCTGREAVRRLQAVFGDRVSDCRSGMTFRFALG